jgi:hypothetical protein
MPQTAWRKSGSGVFWAEIGDSCRNKTRQSATWNRVADLVIFGLDCPRKLAGKVKRAAEMPPPYSDFHSTVKLVPLDVRDADGIASSTPLLVTIVITCTPLPKALIAPDVDVSVASLVPETPV